MFTKKMLRNGLQFPFMIKGFPEINMRGFVETTLEGVTLRKPEREHNEEGALLLSTSWGGGYHPEVWEAGLWSVSNSRREKHFHPWSWTPAFLSPPRSLKQVAKSFRRRVPEPLW